MKLNVGGQQTIGRFPIGWICVDILAGADIQQDISTTPLPWGANVADAVYCSHVIEHIWPWRHDFVVSEFYRVMKPGARLRVVVPDMDIAINDYIRYRGDECPGRLAGCMGWWFNPTLDKDGNVCMNHVHGFNWYSMRDLLKRAGFGFITRASYGMRYHVFDGCDNPGHENTSLYVEAVK